MSHPHTGLSLALLYGALLAMAVIRRRGMKDIEPGSLAKGERQRPLLMTWLDPVIAVIFVGSVFVGLLDRDPWHLVAALVSGMVGIPIGIARAKVMFVRSQPHVRAVVFRRSGLEYGLLGLLLLLRLVEGSIETLHNGTLTWLLTALIALALVESITRALAITRRYHAHAASLS